jgi:predicted dithiol-disulfide oxidoreductase (DUF899 family)
MKTDSAIDLEREIALTEEELVWLKEKLAELRRQLPRQEVKDYFLQGWDGKEAALSSFFGRKPDLILIHNMGKGCAYCTLWADEFNGILHHIENRAGFVVVSPNDPETQREFARSRGWKFKMYSFRGTTFNKDMGFENAKGGPRPGVSVFRKEADGKIHRVSYAGFGPGDDFCGVWHLFDLLAEGVNGWAPKFTY